MAQCTAHTKSNGTRCKQPSIAGGHVCRYHGGSAPQVKNKAAQRLAAIVDPCVAKLAKFVNSKQQMTPLMLRAIADVLDRNNLRGDNLIRLQNPDAGHATPVGLTAEQLARIEALKPDELQVIIRVLGFVEAGTDRAGPTQLTQ